MSETITITRPEEIADYLSSVKCKPQDCQAINGASRTIAYETGNSPSLAVAGAYLLDALGFPANVMNFVTSDSRDVRKVQMLSTPVWENGQFYSSGVPTPQGIVGENNSASSLEELAAGLHKGLEEIGYKPRIATFADLGSYEGVMDWKNNEGSPLIPRLPYATRVDYKKYL